MLPAENLEWLRPVDPLALLQATLEATTDGILTTALNGTLSGCNQRLLQLWRLPAENLTGRNASELHRQISQNFANPAAYLARVAAITRATRSESYDLLQTVDGRHIEQFSRTLVVAGQDVARAWTYREITQQVQAELARLESESQLNLVVNHVPAYIVRCDRDLRFRFVNQAYADRFGKRPEEIVGMAILDLVGEAALAVSLPHIQRVLAGEVVEYDVETEYKVIGTRYVRGTLRPERNDAGEVIGWIAIVNDFTDRDQADQTRNLLGAIVESSHDAIISKTLDGQILSWNAGAEHLFGYSPAEAIGQSISLIIPADRADDERLILQCVRRGERVEHYETIRQARDGRRVEVSLSISPLYDRNGKVVGASKIGRDISARKRTEESARFLADASAALAELTDYRQTLQRIADLAVPAFADWCAIDMLESENSFRRLAVTHVDPSQVSLVHRLDELYPARPDDEGGLFKVLRTGSSVLLETVTDELLASRARDETHFELLRSLRLRSYLCIPLKSRGKVTGALTFATAGSGRVYSLRDQQIAEDLAHRAAIAIENASLLAALRETDRRKDEFLATLAHELRNPLAPIRNGLQVLRLSDELSDESAELRDLMERQVNHLVHLVDDLMEVSRVSRGNVELRREVVALSAIVDSAIEMSRPLVDDAGHQLTVSLPPQTILLNVDRVRISQVLANLLTNSAKYTDVGGQIALSVTVDNGEAAVAVTDSGLGIPEEMLPRIFDIFTQMDHTRGHSQGGLGIGLALARSLVEMHGGRIEARSAGLGQGSTFLVRLPLATDQTVPESSTVTAEMSLPLPARRILVVDDTRAVRFVLERLLRAMGQQVQAAPDAVTALTLAQSDPPDMVISDIGMPDIDGYEFARRLRQVPELKNVLLVALTGYGQGSDRKRARDAGFDHHLVKPVSVDELQRLLATAVAK